MLGTSADCCRSGPPSCPTHFGIVVESWSCELLQELALQDFFKKRGVSNFGSGLYWSTLELQFGLLDSSLDQLVEVSDVENSFIVLRV